MSRTWEDGVKDAARIVQNEMRHKKAIDYPSAKVPIAVFATLNEVELHLAAMLSRGSYESRDTVMQQSRGADCVQRSIEDLMQRVSEHRVLDMHDSLVQTNPQSVPCPDCGGTGSDCMKFPITGCATCEGDGRLQTNPRWLNNETQFARLLCEIVATSPVGQNPDIHALAESMDLTPSDVRELFDRAEQVWEKAKAEVK